MAPIRSHRLAVAGILSGFVLASTNTFPAMAQTAVDLELVLAMDCSYSVDSEEFGLQALGISDAFRSPEIIQAIGNGRFQSIGVTVLQWSSYQSQQVAIPWTLVDGPESALMLSARIAAMPRLTAEGATSISGAIEAGIELFTRSPFSSVRRVIDVSGDGRNNSGPPLSLSRAHAEALNVTINGLAILNDVPTLDYYYRQQLIGGPAAFVIKANDYEDYITAIRQKLLKEIRSFPVSRNDSIPPPPPLPDGQRRELAELPGPTGSVP